MQIKLENKAKDFTGTKHGSKGIRQLPIKLKYIPNSDTQNYPFCILQLVVEMFGHST